MSGLWVANETLTPITAANIVVALAKALNIDAKSKVTVVTPAADKLALKITARTGAIAGTFTHPVTGKKLKVTGVILQKQRLGAGFFPSGGESGSFTLAPAGP